MPISAIHYAVGSTIDSLAANVATKITAGFQPHGPVSYLDRLYTQMMIQGTAETYGNFSTDLAALQANATAPTALSADGAIAIVSKTYVITKGLAAALTLAAPSASQPGTKIRILNGTAFSHVITATGLIDDGVIGGSKNTITFGAFVGSAIVLEAYNLKWIVVNKNVATVA